MGRTIEFTVVDAFVIDGKVFTGNPAAVIVLDRDVSSSSISLNLSQTFLGHVNKPFYCCLFCRTMSPMS